QQLLQQLESYNLLIIGLGEGRITATQRRFVNVLLEKFDCVVVCLGAIEEKVSEWKPSGTDSWVLNFGEARSRYAVMAQLLFGGIAPHGRMRASAQQPKLLSETEKANWQNRLGYAPPETVRMDGVALRRQIDSIVLDGITNEAYPGAQVLVARSGKVVFSESYGYHTYDQVRPVRSTDLYDYASVTKVSAALPAIMKLHGAGRFDLDATLGDYFREMRGSNKADLDFRNILAHQAQLKPYIVYWASTLKKNGRYKWRTFRRKKNRRYHIRITDELYLHRQYKKKMYKAIRQAAQEDEKAYKYSGLSFLLYPEMLSRITGVEYESYLQQTFYRPLGAHTITFNPYLKFPLDRIVPTERDTFFRMTQVHGAVHDEAAAMLNGVSANAGLFSNANDLAKLFQMYLNKGTYGGERYIAASSVELFTSCAFCETGNHRGLGFDKPRLEFDESQLSISSVSSPSSFGHSGYTGTFVWADPEQELLFIFFSNRVHPTRNNRKLYSMNIRPQLLKVIYDAIDVSAPAGQSTR
ncbi:MAG: serine hydrolase domain-containing protein, partial [Bacteroidota bacterium]